MGRVVTPDEKNANLFRIVPFIQTNVLLSRRWLGTSYRDTVKGPLEKFNIMRVGSADLDSQRSAATIGQYGTLGSQFSPIRRIFTCIFPRPEAI